MKTLTILGTRPELIRLSLIIPKLDKFCNHILVDTQQNYDYNMSGIFYKELGIRVPDYALGVRGSFGDQIAAIMQSMEVILRAEKPDKVLVLGDTNSSLGAIMAKRMGIPVYHMEAGNRAFSDVLPEEVNRRLIDHSSDVLMPYTERSRQNLLREGIPSERIFVTGNPIREVMKHFQKDVHQCTDNAFKYLMVTLHRSETVDNKERLHNVISALQALSGRYAVILSTHPHTAAKLKYFLIDTAGIDCVEPFGFFEFMAYERDAQCVLTDSGTVQEETCILKVPNVILRDVTERPETLECGSGILAGTDPDNIVRAVDVAISTPCNWEPPLEYMRTNVSDTVVKILLGS